MNVWRFSTYLLKKCLFKKYEELLKKEQEKLSIMLNKNITEIFSFEEHSITKCTWKLVL